MRFFIVFLVISLIGPFWLLVSQQVTFSADYRTANRASSNIAPLPEATQEAVIQAYSARAFNWRGLFAVHTWIAVKPTNAKKYKVYDVVGWRMLHSEPVLGAMEDIPDRHWFDQKPQLILDIRGERAAALIPQIVTAVEQYPYPNEYHYWPGPNSNTFVAYIAREVPALSLMMPSNAIGKDFLVNNRFLAPAPSGTGYQVSLFGVVGVTLALREGLEVNFLGLVYGISPSQGVVKLPGLGELRLF